MLTRRNFVLSNCAACAALANLGIVDAIAAGGPSTEDIPGPGYVIHFINHMRDVIMSGKRDAVLDLRTLNKKSHLYGLGPIEGLTGEVTIIDGKPALSRIGADHLPHVTESYDVGVPFFVWAEVDSWRTITIPSTVTSSEELEKFIGETASKFSLDKAFPFLVTGKLKLVNYHVVNAKPDTPAGMEAHKQIQVPFDLKQSTVTLVGFWSNQHRGVFTPMDSNMHVHFQSADNIASGHVQHLELSGNENTLHLPNG